MNDMNTVGFTGPLDKGRTVLVGPDRVTVCGGRSYGCVQVMSLPSMLLPPSRLCPCDKSFP